MNKKFQPQSQQGCEQTRGSLRNPSCNKKSANADNPTDTFCLSECIFNCNVSIGFDEDYQKVIYADHVREVIRRLKEDIHSLFEVQDAPIHNFIDNIFLKRIGDKLI